MGLMASRKSTRSRPTSGRKRAGEGTCVSQRKREESGATAQSRGVTVREGRRGRGEGVTAARNGMMEAVSERLGGKEEVESFMRGVVAMAVII